MSISGRKAQVLVILGPTASGKTALGVKLAAKMQGEIVSADSRQVFRGMDIGTGKDLKDYRVAGKRVPYHLIDICDPMDEYNLAKYQKEAFKAIGHILAKGKLPIIVGGSGLYLQAVVDGYVLAPGVPDKKQRALLEKLSASEMYQKLLKLKPEFAKHLNNSDKNNPRRLVRYLEIALNNHEAQPSFKTPPYDFLILGLNPADDLMKERILKRLKYRLEKEGMVSEVERLLDEGVTPARLQAFGLEYRYLTWYLQDKLDYEEMVEKLGTAIYRFAKRQKTWFKRWSRQGKDIKEVNSLEEAEQLVAKWRK